MTDLTTWLSDRLEDAGYAATDAEEHVRIARYSGAGFTPTQAAYLAGITGVSVEELQQRALADRDQRAAEGRDDLEASPEFRFLRACFPDAEL